MNQPEDGASLSLRQARVLAVDGERAGLQTITVLIDGQSVPAVSYELFCGRLAPGDDVLVNTTAVELGLGSGGVHFVVARPGYSTQQTGPGHLMKLKYTPLQFKYYGPEDPAHPEHDALAGRRDLAEAPVVALELHSQLQPVVATLHRLRPGLRVVYLMSDGGALAMGFSMAVAQLRERGLLAAVVTCGQAFGGDLEALNVYSGLLQARHVAKADVVVSAVGPGLIGSATPYGFSTDQGEVAHAALSLRGRVVFGLRVSDVDPRRAHRGLSHHTRTMLSSVLLQPVDVAVPYLPDGFRQGVESALTRAAARKGHRLHYREGALVEEALAAFDLKPTVMGRSVPEDRLFFWAAGAAGVLAEELLQAQPRG